VYHAQALKDIQLSQDGAMTWTSLQQVFSVSNHIALLESLTHQQILLFAHSSVLASTTLTTSVLLVATTQVLLC
jgi:hypothetical protein